MTTEAPETGNRNELTTSSGVKLSFTAKGLCQPDITLRYPTPDLAMQYAARDAFALLDDISAKAHMRGITLVTEQQEGR